MQVILLSLELPTVYYMQAGTSPVFTNVSQLKIGVYMLISA